MLLFGHVGITLGAGWAVQAAACRAEDRWPGLHALGKGLDLRWLIGGSLLPDAIDKGLMFAFPASPVGSGRSIAHSLLFLIVLLVAGLVARSPARGVIAALSAGTLGHLVLDSMWAMPRTLLWPVLGWSFEPLGVGDFAARILHGLETNPAVYIPEAAGAAICLLLGTRLLAAGRVGWFLKTGRAER